VTAHAPIVSGISRGRTTSSGGSLLGVDLRTLIVVYKGARRCHHGRLLLSSAAAAKRVALSRRVSMSIVSFVSSEVIASVKVTVVLCVGAGDQFFVER